MSRAPFQILVFPYIITFQNEILYAIFKCELKTEGYWQGIAGGSEDNESPLEAAKREAYEEAGISPISSYIVLDSQTMIPVEKVCGYLWGDDVTVIPEHCFGVKTPDKRLQLSEEHTEYKWLTCTDAIRILHWDSNKNTLQELDHRLRQGL